MEEWKTCSCERCKLACRRPGWTTPEEAEVLIDQGLADRLMCDWWDSYDGDDIYILCPANPGYGGSPAPTVSIFSSSALTSGCTFFKKGLCEIHDKGKPLECRLYHHDEEEAAVSERHRSVVALWDNEEGRRVVERWESLTGNR